MNILDNAGHPTSIDALNERAKAWHAAHDEAPVDRRTPERVDRLAAQLSSRCHTNQHARCGRVVALRGLGVAAWPTCLCTCHGVAA